MDYGLSFVSHEKWSYTQLHRLKIPLKLKTTMLKGWLLFKMTLKVYPCGIPHILLFLGEHRRLSESSNFCNFAWLGHQDVLKGSEGILGARLEIPVIRIQPCRIGECSAFSIRSFSASGLNFWDIAGILSASSRMPISYLVFWETLRVFAAACYQVSADVIAYGTVWGHRPWSYIF